MQHRPQAKIPSAASSTCLAKVEDFLEGGSDEEAADDADDDEEGADGEESESTASEA